METIQHNWHNVICIIWYVLTKWYIGPSVQSDFQTHFSALAQKQKEALTRYRGSSGWTAIATSPSIVSGRVVDTATSPSKPKSKWWCTEHRLGHTSLSRQPPILTLPFHRVCKCIHYSKLYLVFISGNRQQSLSSQLLSVHLTTKALILCLYAHFNHCVTGAKQTKQNIMSHVTRLTTAWMWKYQNASEVSITFCFYSSLSNVNDCEAVVSAKSTTFWLENSPEEQRWWPGI